MISCVVIVHSENYSWTPAAQAKMEKPGATLNLEFSTIETSLVTEYTTTSSMPSYKFL